VPRFGPTGSYGGHVGCCVDVTEHRAQAERLLAALREKEVLLAEVHHRVKNNLAIIAKPLESTVRAIEDLSVREVLAESEGRVRAIALIHQGLYERSPGTRPCSRSATTAWACPRGSWRARRPRSGSGWRRSSRSNSRAR
jgi:hypothetical protein